MTKDRRQLTTGRLLALLTFSLIGFLLGCGGDDGGIRNGTIIGKVFSSVRNSSAEVNPEPGVTVVAQRDGNPQLIRSTVSDQNGNYAFMEIPLGGWTVGFAKEGFRPIPTTSGATDSRTALGNQVRVFVEPKEVSEAADVVLVAVQPTGNVTLILTLIDSVTGQRITHGNVRSPPVSTSENTDGVYTLVVPLVRDNTDTPFNSERSINVFFEADGYGTIEVNDFRVLPGQTVRRTQSLIPGGPPNSSQVSITGRMRFLKFPSAAPAFDQINIRVPNINLESPPTINATTGIFTVSRLPPSNIANTRQIDIVFTHPNIKTQTVRSITLPTTGNKALPQDVVLELLTIDVTGEVRVPGRQAQGQTDPGAEEIPNGANDKVVVKETSQVASIINGTYLIPDVPASLLAGAGPQLNLDFQATRPSDQKAFCKNLQITPISDGTETAVFTVPKLTVDGACAGGGGGQ